MSEIATWQLYIVAAVILMILEIFIPGFILFPIGVALLITAVFALFSANVSLQMLVFGLGCLVTFWVAHRWLKPRIYPKQGVKTNVEALVGKEGVVEEEVNYERNTGYVKIYGDSWRARATHQETIAAGERVIVERVESNVISVRRKSQH